MNMEIPNQNTQQAAPFSPKKKLHVKDKETLSDTISHTRDTIKNGRDISARNLTQCTGATGGIPTLRKPNRNNNDDESKTSCYNNHNRPPITTTTTTLRPNSSITKTSSFAIYDPTLAATMDGSESTVSEVVNLEEEHTDFVSEPGSNPFSIHADNDNDDDDEETIVEEIVEEYYVEEEMVPSDDDDDSDSDDDDAVTLDSDAEDFAPLPPPIVIPKSLQVKNGDDKDDDDDDTYNNNNTTIDDSSTYDDDSTLESDKKPAAKTQPTLTKVATASSSSTSTVAAVGTPSESTRPGSIRGYSFVDKQSRATAIAATTAGTVPSSQANDNKKPIMKNNDDGITSSSGHEMHRPDKIRGYSFVNRNKGGTAAVDAATNMTTSTNNEQQPLGIVNEDDIPPSSGHGIGRPESYRGYSFMEPKSSEEKRSTANEANEVPDGSHDDSTAWKKPEWTKKKHLKPTGISPIKNLAKPITQLPQMVNNNEKNDDGDNGTSLVNTPKKSNSSMAKISSNHCTSEQVSSLSICKSPYKAARGKVSSTINTTTPKSEPSSDSGRPRTQATAMQLPQISSPKGNANEDTSDDAFDDSDKKIAWEKPEWAKKRVLRTTSKTEKIYSGGKLERPIGGIRPIDDDKK